MLAPATAARPPARYVPIKDHGAIGEGRSVALVTKEGTIDWWCPGRFDAPSLFASILDADRGGHWRISAVDALQSTQRYSRDSNVLETEWSTATGRCLVRDHLAFEEDTGVADAVLVRRAIGLEGAVDLATELAPRFHYGRILPRFSLTPAGLLASGAGEILLIHAPVAWERARRGVRGARVRLRAGDEISFVLRHAPFSTPAPFPDPIARAPAELEAAAVERWRAWSARTIAAGPHAEHLRRSALALKLLQYAPNGAIVAAATTSLPEAIGGVRNWDYRFTWLRDGVLSAQALADLGHDEDARAFADWLAATMPERLEDLGIMYSISGSPELPEREIPTLEGYQKSAPVRVGNAAAHQRQLDVQGELVIFLAARGSPALVPRVRAIADWVADHWREPDHGIWEMRAPPRHFVLSKAMAWAALTRASAHVPDPPARWRAEANAIRAQVLSAGVSARGTFSQAYGFEQLDASNLLLPMIGFVDARDPIMVRTVDATLRDLTVDGLVYRYLGDDGLPGGEATFAYCSFWLVEALAMQGRADDARALFDKLLLAASPLGLYAEEIDAATGDHLGNFPQAFPHVGLIQAARALERASGENATTRHRDDAT